MSCPADDYVTYFFPTYILDEKTKYRYRGLTLYHVDPLRITRGPSLFGICSQRLTLPLVVGAVALDDGTVLVTPQPLPQYIVDPQHIEAHEIQEAISLLL